MTPPLRFTRRAALAAGIPALMGFGGLQGLLAPKARLWERWTAHAPQSLAAVDHSEWDRLLGAYSGPGKDGIRRFSYERVAPADRTRLAAYLDRLATVEVRRLSRPEQRAFWINLYNALTISVVLDHYPVASIRDIDISPGLFADGPWDRTLTAIEGERLSLNDIEHRILRPIWQDPRLHYAVNCAALGCPDLQPAAFTPANAESLLDAGARAYVNHPRGVRFEGDRLIVSSIYAWFTEDFGGGEAAVIGHLSRFAEPALEARLAAARKIDDHAYAGRLNDAVAARAANGLRRPPRSAC